MLVRTAIVVQWLSCSNISCHEWLGPRARWVASIDPGEKTYLSESETRVLSALERASQAQGRHRKLARRNDLSLALNLNCFARGCVETAESSGKWCFSFPLEIIPFPGENSN